jgi:hypothetical protein
MITLMKGVSPQIVSLMNRKEFVQFNSFEPCYWLERNHYLEVDRNLVELDVIFANSDNYIGVDSVACLFERNDSTQAEDIY